jgi:hypothetical protein
MVWVDAGAVPLDGMVVDGLAVAGAGASVEVLVRGTGPLVELQFTGPADDIFVVLIEHERETVTRTASTGRFWADSGLAAITINPSAAIAGA